MFTLFLDSAPVIDDDELLLLWSMTVERGYTGACQRLLRTGFPVDHLYVQSEYPDYITALMHACGASHGELILLLLSNGADPTLLDNHGRSCILLASAQPYDTYTGSEEEAHGILQLLLKTDAIQHIDRIQNREDPEVKDLSLPGRHGWPLADVCQNLSTKAVQMLLEAGADPNLKDQFGWTALHAACRWHVSDAVEIVRLLVLYGADVNATSDNGWTPLGCASWIGSFVDILDILVKAGAHIESTAGEMTTALQIATRHDVSGGEVVKYLVRAGADVNATGGQFGSVLLSTLERPQSFIKDASGRLSISNQQPQIIDFLSEFVKYGLDINSVPEGRGCALQRAAEKGLPHVVSFLLEQGAKLPYLEIDSPITSNSNQSDIPVWGRTAPRKSILSGVQTCYHEVFQVLLAAGVSPDADSIDIIGDWDMTLLGTACSRDNESYLKTATLLLQHGADPNFRDRHGHLPIQLAVYAVSLAHVRKLVEYGTDMEMNEDDEYGSLLHSLFKGAASSSQPEIGRDTLLGCWHFLQSRLPRGTVWTQDDDGRTCLHYLAEMSAETRLLVKVDGCLSWTESPVMLMLREFLDSHGQPHPLERVPDPSLGVFFLADTDGRLAFHVMALRGDVHAMSCLINHIMAVETSSERDPSANSFAVSALLTPCDNHGWTALHYAASQGQAVACNYLLQVSELDELTSVGESVVDLANQKHHYQLAEFVASYIEGAVTGEEALTRSADSALVRVAKRTFTLDFSTDKLMEAFMSESKRISNGREP